MSARQWKPGDVGISAAGERFTVTSSGRCFWPGDAPDAWAGISGKPTQDDRPLVVIDPEDNGLVARLGEALAKSGAHRGRLPVAAEHGGIQRALRSLIAPPLPKVYAHIRTDIGDGVSHALCGKVWRAGEEVEVVGNCPNCRDLAEEWVS